jgi:hypothetical protein
VPITTRVDLQGQVAVGGVEIVDPLARVGCPGLGGAAAVVDAAQAGVERRVVEVRDLERRDQGAQRGAPGHIGVGPSPRARPGDPPPPAT